MTLPHQGGSYRREKDGSLKRIDAEVDAPAVIEQEAEKPADTETAPKEEPTARKGKA
jgi:hypothetical protein